MTALIFSVNVLVWGFSWIAITFQIAEAPGDVALFYRMVIAAAALFAVLALTGRLRPVSWREQFFLAVTGLLLFSINYMLAYTGAGYLPSGVVALVFSMATVFNAFHSMVFFGERQSVRFIVGAMLGMGGLAGMFWHDLAGFDLTSGALTGAGIMLAATYVFSLGNMMSRRNNEAGIDLPTATAWAMSWGAVFLLIFALFKGRHFSLDYSTSFYVSLLYLALAGTTVGFLTYLEIVKRLGAPLAAFSAVLYPAIALTVSTFVEGYQWTATSVAGLVLIAAGNILVFMPASLISRVRFGAARSSPA
jgi:drug/metabolite transporter (DMT)-like permease